MTRYLSTPDDCAFDQHGVVLINPAAREMPNDSSADFDGQILGNRLAGTVESIDRSINFETAIIINKCSRPIGRRDYLTISHPDIENFDSIQWVGGSLRVIITSFVSADIV